jgi:anti-sigma factor RsiW
MSDDRTPREPAQNATLACAAGVTPDTLSAWRDGLLPDAQAAWLAAHTPTCPACGARLRDYEQIGAALRGQIIPRSATDPWPAMLRRIQRERRGRRAHAVALGRAGRAGGGGAAGGALRRTAGASGRAPTNAGRHAHRRADRYVGYDTDGDARCLDSGSRLSGCHQYRHRAV